MSLPSSRQATNRRTQNYWEPIFNPSLKGVEFRVGDWEFANFRGPHRQVLFADALIGEGRKPKMRVIKDIKFSECDFQGDFEADTQFTFKNCEFKGCDLGLSTWTNVKFSDCKFEKCTLTLSKWNRCDFLRCQWVDIAFSSNETDMTNCLISNPKKFITAGYTNLDSEVLSEKKVDPLYQWMRNELTKATMARHLFVNSKSVGGDINFYESVQAYEQQQSFSSIASSLFDVQRGSIISRLLSLFPLLYSVIEYALMTIFGVLNGWGSKPLKPLIAIMLNWLAFGCVYQFWPNLICDADAFSKSFNIASLAGYTNELSLQNSQILNQIQVVQLIIAIVLYTVFFATVVGRLCRVR